jgi:hypothetical protein
MMPTKKQQIPKESSLQLYRSLVKEAEQRNSKYAIRPFAPSHEREIMRVLEILSLLPKSQHQNNTSELLTQNKQVKIKRKKQLQKVACGEEQSKMLASSPYHHSLVKRNTRNGSKCSFPKRIKRKQEKTQGDQSIVLRRNQEYIWHPITIKTGQGKEKDTIVYDVLKYYQSQYHRSTRKQSKKK